MYLQVDTLLDDFFGSSEVTESTFNFEELIVPEAPTTSTSLSPLRSSINRTEAPPAPPTTAPTTISTGSPNITLPLIGPSTTQPRTDSAQTPSDPPLLIPTAISPTGIVTRKRARDLAATAPVDNATLTKLLAKYHINQWLQPFVLNIQEVDSDGHCGFQAIAVSIGRSQDEWPYIRQQLELTLLKSPDIFSDQSLPDLRADGLTRLRTRKANVVSEQKYWLTMPGWGGVIATTFNRPVIFYGNCYSSQINFPYLTPPNNSPPIVLALASLHFCSLTLDFTRPNLPVPNYSTIWQQYCTPEASKWVNIWKPLIDRHADFMKTRNGKRQSKKQAVPIHVE